MSNIDKDIEIVSQCIVESISVPLNLDDIDLNDYRDAISNVLKDRESLEKEIDKYQAKANAYDDLVEKIKKRLRRTK